MKEREPKTIITTTKKRKTMTEKVEMTAEERAEFEAYKAEKAMLS